jgi:hypothetical protein
MQLLQIKTTRHLLPVTVICYSFASASLVTGTRGIQIGDLTRIERFNLYKILVYARTRDRYPTFCTPECAAAIDEYLATRQRNIYRTPHYVVAATRGDLILR